MKLQDFFDEINSRAFRNGTEGNYLYKLARLFVRKAANLVLPVYLKSQKRNNCDRVKADVIVSLTSFPARINQVWYTIRTLKQQSVVPEKIILWLSKEQFPHAIFDIPKELQEEFDEQFEIRFIDDDLRSHKKYFYSFEEFADKVIITVDDDIYYNSRLLEFLLEKHNIYPNCVICNRGHVISKDTSYSRWETIKDVEGPSFNIIPTGVGGVLYPPHCYDEHIFDRKAIRETCLRADDLWLNFMCRLKGTKVVTTGLKFSPITVEASQKEALCKTNNGKISGNDAQIVSISQWTKKYLGVDFFYRVNY